MGILLYRCGVALLAAACAASCAGNGDGLNAQGEPISTGGSSSGPITADLQSIEDNVFTPICSKCHIGASAPEGLQLDAAHAYNDLVGVPSAEEPNFLRVNPGNPDLSYMVLKIEGAPGIEGGQMPLGETPLPQATIDAIRQWITNGAPNVPATAASQVLAVQSTTPQDSSIVSTPVRQIVVAFTQELDATLVNESTVTLERIRPAVLDPAPPDPAGLDPETATQVGGAQEKIAVASALAAHNPAVLLITPTSPLAAGVYRVTLRGTGGGALANLSAATLGTDVSWEFTVTAAQ
jgi:hypothetical protein